jgi:prostaglandin-H2 D-isomerase / glutathione transferase
MPMGQMPILEVDGKVMYQSGAICRYLATKVGLAGSDACENYQIDNVVESMNDYRSSEFLFAIHSIELFV